MKHRSAICLVLTVLMAMALTGCAMGQELLLGGEDVLSGPTAAESTPLPEQTPLPAEEEEPAPPAGIVGDPNPPVPTPTPPSTVPDPTAEPTPTATPTEKPTPTPKPTAKPTPVPTEAPEAAIRPGTYTGEDGSVLTVASDGACAYETFVPMVVGGEELTEAVTFRGTVTEDGVFQFTKVSYHGMDITSFAVRAGYEDCSPWEGSAAALYEKTAP